MLISSLILKFYECKFGEKIVISPNDKWLLDVHPMFIKCLIGKRVKNGHGSKVGKKDTSLRHLTDAIQFY